MRTWMHVLMLVPLLLLAAACGGNGNSGAGSPTSSRPGAAPLPRGSEPVELDPADFVAEIDNPYWPMRPGSTWVYRETDAEGACSASRSG